MPPVEGRLSWKARAADLGDLDALLSLEVEGFGRPWTAAMYREELARESSWVEVVVDDLGDPGERGEVVGFVCAWQILDACHLLRIATRKALRNGGIAQTLVRRLIDLSTRRGCSHIELEVASQNASALALYERLGFAAVGRRPRYYSQPVDDAILMNLSLSPAAAEDS